MVAPIRRERVLSPTRLRAASERALSSARSDPTASPTAVATDSAGGGVVKQLMHMRAWCAHGEHMHTHLLTHARSEQLAELARRIEHALILGGRCEEFRQSTRRAEAEG